MSEMSYHKPSDPSASSWSLLEAAITRLTATGIVLSAPVHVHPWRGEPRHGRFVRVDAATCALHVGRGFYVMLDIQRDLNGVVPSEMKRLMLQRSGTVREPDMRGRYTA